MFILVLRLTKDVCEKNLFFSRNWTSSDWAVLQLLEMSYTTVLSSRVRSVCVYVHGPRRM